MADIGANDEKTRQSKRTGAGPVCTIKQPKREGRLICENLDQIRAFVNSRCVSNADTNGILAALQGVKNDK